MSIPSRKSLRNIRGFTLVELLVVIAVIGILSTILILQLNAARAKARDTKRVTDVSQIRTAVELYYDAKNQQYPSTDLASLPAGDFDVYFQTKLVPTDPQAGTAYFYNWDPLASPTRYQVAGELEQSSAALRTDADINSTAWGGGNHKVNGATEACTSAVDDCIYDIGLSQ